jgi:hypothetical protein
MRIYIEKNENEFLVFKISISNRKKACYIDNYKLNNNKYLPI